MNAGGEEEEQKWVKMGGTFLKLIFIIK